MTIPSKFNLHVLIVISATLILVLLYRGWSADKDAQGQLGQLRNELTQLQLRAIRAEKQVSDVDKLYFSCKEKFNDATKDIESLRVKGDAMLKKINDLEKQLQLRISIIQKLVLSSASGGVQLQEAPHTANSVAPEIDTGASSGQCKVWTPLADRNSINGIRQFQLSTIVDCKQHCITLVSCVAVDFDGLSVPLPSCWIHDSDQDIKDENTYSQIGTTQYRINRTCLSEISKNSMNST